METRVEIEWGNTRKALSKEMEHRERPDGPVAKTLSFHCRGHGFDPWLGN